MQQPRARPDAHGPADVRSASTDVSDDLADVRDDLAALRQRLAEAERTLEAIRAGQVEAAAASERRFRTSLDALLDGFVVLTARRGPGGRRVEDMRIEFANPAACALFGRRFDDVVGHGFSEVVPAPLEATLMPALVAVVVEHTPLRTELSWPRANDVSEIEMHAAQLDDGCVVTMHDVTARRRSERAIHDAHRQLEHHAADLARANDDLADIVYVVSHDLNEPLRTVEGFAALLSERYADTLDPTAGEFLDYITSGVARMRRLLSDLLRYSRLNTETAPFEDVDLGAVVTDVVADLGATIEETGAVIEVGSLPVVTGDRSQLSQLMQNLLTNAMKFVAPHVRPQVAITAADSGDRWEVTVADNGIGIPESGRARVFKMFVRLQPPDAYPGTGLGLAICRKVIERHGGDIRVADNPGGGSRLVFTVPKQPSRP